jgi:hypothetical protein
MAAPTSLRQRQWLLVAAAFAVAGALWHLRGSPTRAGDVVEASLTLTTADRDQVACALDRAVGLWRCAFAASGEASTAAEAGTLAPYLTTARVLFLLPRLFQQAAVAERTRREPPEDRLPDTLKRFVARCQVRLLERVDGVRVRWATTGVFGGEEVAWAAEPIDCRVEEP